MRNKDTVWVLYRDVNHHSARLLAVRPLRNDSHCEAKKPEQSFGDRRRSRSARPGWPDNAGVPSPLHILTDRRQSSSVDDRIAAAMGLGASDPRIGALTRVEPGSFLMGSAGADGLPAERPQHTVDLSGFEIGIVAVTVGEFAKFVEHGYGDRGLWSEEGWAWRETTAATKPRFWGEEEWKNYLAPNQPVVGVSWFEADAYCRHAGRRLPTEAEWERAARGEDGRIFPWGNDWIAANAAHRGGLRHTLPVGCFPAGVSPHGLYDAAGNVWEWVADGYDPKAYERPEAGRDPRGPASAEMKVARGGSWNALPPQLRCTNRNAWKPGARFSNLGFRVAR
jgi:formylglycine-generating enzyme required for sulfatase activity